MPLNCGNTQSDEWAGRDLSIDCGGTRCGPRGRTGTVIPRPGVGGNSFLEIRARAHDQAS